MTKPQVRLVSAVFNGEQDERQTDGKAWRHFAWTVTLGCDGRTLVTPWRAGIGHADKRTGKPTQPKAEEVLGSLIMDSTAGSNSFADFCDEMGMDTDSRRALETYLACQKIAADLRKLLGVDPVALIYERDAEEVASDLCAAV